MFFRTEGSGVYVVMEPYGHGYICMGTFENLGTPEHPIYYFDGRYTDHMIEEAMIHPVFGKKHTKAEAMRFAKRLAKAWHRSRVVHRRWGRPLFPREYPLAYPEWVNAS